MNHLHIIILALLVPILANSQQTIEGSITHDGLQRTYILYVPEKYTPGTAVPLILNFHGYTSNNLEQMFYGDFRPIADTAGFIVVHPMGTIDQLNNPHWNVGWGTSTVNDVGFTAALIDSLSATYTIDAERIYSTGMSNGGFFSYKLACELSDRIAAIASVTGTMNVNQTATCNPSHPMPVMEIHGTADETVAYDGNFFFASTPTVVAWWADRNECDTPPTITAMEDTDSADGCTAEHHVYINGNSGSSVEHYKIIGGQHTWPGSAFGGVGTNQDIDASKEIWRFFSKYDIHGLINPTSISDSPLSVHLNVYPNPANDFVIIDWPFVDIGEFSLHATLGTEVLKGNLVSGKNEIDCSALSPGIYFFSAGYAKQFTAVVVIQGNN